MLYWNISLKEWLCYDIGILTQMRRVTNTSLLFWVNIPSLNGALPSEEMFHYLLNAKPPFMSWPRSAFNEVNDWAESRKISCKKKIYRPGKAFPSDDNIGQFLANSKKGVVYMSFGTVIKSSLMSDETKEIFRKMFLKFSDYDFIWKLDKGPNHLLHWRQIFVKT